MQHQKQSELTEKLATGLGWFSIGLGLTEMVAPGALARLIGISDTEGNRSLLRFYGMRELAAGIGILSQPQAPQWMWSRVGGDMLDLASLGRAMSNESNGRAKLGAATAAVLGVTALDIVCAQQLSQKQQEASDIEAGAAKCFRTSIVVNCTPDTAYNFWRNFSNFPKFMSNLESVQMTGSNRSHWIAKGPGGRRIEWDAESEEDQARRQISWHSHEGADIRNSGSVRFEQSPGGRGTIIHVQLMWEPPMGTAGALVAKLMGRDPEQQIEQGLRHLKQILELGEVVHSDASIHSGMHPARPDRDAPAPKTEMRTENESMISRRTSMSEPNWVPTMKPHVH